MDGFFALALLVLWIYGVICSWKSSALFGIVSFFIPVIGMIAGFIALLKNGKV